MGRTVPWICWEEWYTVRGWLLSQSRADMAQGIQRVEVWRARGRVPLGVDTTASLLETALCDASFWGAADAAAAAAGSHLSQQQLRLQYAATIVRMVNGIADSQQKGRVAVSVNTLAESAGLSRLLVDVRHEATHNELPSLSTLQLAARQALDWLLQQYWQRQADHVTACHARVAELLSAILSSCEAAATAGRRTGAAAAAAAGSDVEGEDDGEGSAAEGCGGSYRAAEGRKQRKSQLAELKGLLPPSHTPLLVELLLDNTSLFCGGTSLPSGGTQQQVPPSAAAAAAAAAAGGSSSAGRGQAPQGLAGAAELGFSAAAQQAAFTSLLKTYPQLVQQLLEEAVSRLCSRATAAGPAAAAAAAPLAGQDVGAAQAQADSVGEQQLLQWLHLLLPGTFAAADGPTAAAGGAAGAGVGSTGGVAGGGRSSRKVATTKRTFGLTPALDAKQQQQLEGMPQQQQQQVVTQLQQKLLAVWEPSVLKGLVRDSVKAIGCLCSTAAAKQPTPAVLQANSAAQAGYSAPDILLPCLQEVQRLLLTAVAGSSSSSSGSRGVPRFQQLCQLAAPQQQQQIQQQHAAGLDQEWLQQQHTMLGSASAQQQQLLMQQQQQGRKRPHAALEQPSGPAAAATAAAAAAAGGGGSGGRGGASSSNKWRRAEGWRPSAIGCLPGPRSPSVLLSMLAAPEGVAAAAAADAAAAAAAAAAGGGVADSAAHPAGDTPEAAAGALHAAMQWEAAGQFEHGGVTPAAPGAAAGPGTVDAAAGDMLQQEGGLHTHAQGSVGFADDDEQDAGIEQGQQDKSVEQEGDGQWWQHMSQAQMSELKQSVQLLL